MWNKNKTVQAVQPELSFSTQPNGGRTQLIFDEDANCFPIAFSILHSSSSVLDSLSELQLAV